ncbi:MAG: hypothetical protein CSA66_07305 [Proteobacteria bacterium]|nr:MAG: hypothetical protein CSA66_07305 [Pseudomonadota bacterium]
MIQRSLRALIAAALLLPAATALADDGSAPAYDEDDSARPAGEPCDDDSACDDGQTCVNGSCVSPTACDSGDECWTGWCADGVCAEPPACAEDAECGEGYICDWGSCASKGNSCLSDADCGVYTRCELDGGGASEPSSGSAEASAQAGSGDSRQGAPDAPRAEWPERGRCVIDAEVLPVAEGCVALCEAAVACEGVEGAPPPRGATPPSQGDGSATPHPAPYPRDEDAERDQGADDDGDDPDGVALALEACTTACSFGVALEMPGSELVADVAACLEANGCDAVEASCGSELEAVVEMFEAIEDVVEVGVGRAEETTSAAGGTGDEASQHGTGATAGTREGLDSDGCSGGGAGAPWALALAALMLLALRLRGREGVRVRR